MCIYSRCIHKDILENLADDAIVFAMANPNPEATYADMKAAGIRIAGTGRSDAPNQINNVAVFPGVFRGAIDRTCGSNH